MSGFWHHSGEVRNEDEISCIRKAGDYGLVERSHLPFEQMLDRPGSPICFLSPVCLARRKAQTDVGNDLYQRFG